ncbi:hypothetical protein GGF31_000178 [Allomyces arbusculus]|nr:hypothetical protein GGF31_000178 [Allomyces arbusculus]
MSSHDSRAHAKRGAFADVYRKTCQQLRAYPLSYVLTPAFFNHRIVRVPGDKVAGDNDWGLLTDSLALAVDLGGVCIWSNWWDEKKRQLMKLKSGKELERATATLKAKIPLILHDEVTTPLLGSVASAILHSPNFTTLTLDGIILKPMHLKSLCQAVIKSKSLTHLSLARCEIGDAGFAELAPSIKSSSSLSILILADNQLTHSSAALLAEALKSQSVRRVEAAFPDQLRVSVPRSSRSFRSKSLHGRLSVDSGIAITTSRSFLKRINLSCNRLGDCGLFHLIDAVQNDVGVQVIDLQFNQITNEGAEAVLLVLKDMRGMGAMTAFDLRGNANVDPKFVTEVFEMGDAMCRTNPDLQRLADGIDPLLPTLHLPPSHSQAIIAKQRAKIEGKAKGAKLRPKREPVVHASRAAWRPAGKLPPPKLALSTDKSERTKEMHPTVDVAKLSSLVVTNHELATKVKTLETALMHAINAPVPRVGADSVHARSVPPTVVDGNEPMAAARPSFAPAPHNAPLPFTAGPAAMDPVLSLPHPQGHLVQPVENNHPGDVGYPLDVTDSAVVDPCSDATPTVDLMAVGDLIKQLHLTLVGGAVTPWTLLELDRQVQSAHAAVRQHPYPIFSDALRKLEARAEHARRQLWDRSPEAMRHVVDVDQWVADHARATSAARASWEVDPWANLVPLDDPREMQARYEREHPLWTSPTHGGGARARLGKAEADAAVDVSASLRLQDLGEPRVEQQSPPHEPTPSSMRRPSTARAPLPPVDDDLLAGLAVENAPKHVLVSAR